MLYDDLLAVVKTNPTSLNMSEAGVKAFSEATVVLANNVAEYYCSGTDQDIWFLDRDFPNVAPPFPSMFVEYKLPHMVRSEIFGTKVYHDYLSATVGAWLTAEEAPAELSVKWVCRASFYTRTGSKNNIRTVPCTISWGVKEDGQYWSPSHRKVHVNIYEPMLDETVKHLKEGAATFLHVPFLTLSFLHCKNVDFNMVTYSSKLQASRVKRGKLPLATYGVLDIKPVRQVLHQIGHSESTGIQRALHICRGHFKDFSKGTGLFGKYQGTYWWSMQTRGSLDAGVHSKDYNVLSPDRNRRQHG